MTITMLKKCPFCGRMPHINKHSIFCDCGANIQIPVYVEGETSLGGLPNYTEARSQMVSAWNTRIK